MTRLKKANSSSSTNVSIIAVAAGPITPTMILTIISNYTIIGSVLNHSVALNSLYYLPFLIIIRTMIPILRRIICFSHFLIKDAKTINNYNNAGVIHISMNIL